MKEEVKQLLEQAEAADEAEDRQYGSQRGDESPEELRRRETRLAKIKEAKKALTLLRELIEGSAITVQHGLLAGEVLPPGHGYIDVRWLQFNGKGDSRFFLAGDGRRSRAGEGLVDCLSGARVVDDWTPHAFDRLLRAVDGLRMIGFHRATEYVAKPFWVDCTTNTGWKKVAA